MITIKNPTTVTFPSASVMPVCHWTGAAFAQTGGFAGVVKVDVRDRRDVETAALKGIFPGTPVWRPPTC